MRAFLMFLVVAGTAAWLGMTALDRLPDPAGVLPARAGPALKDAKTWGYQLQHINTRLIPPEIDLLVVDYSRDGSASRVLTPHDIDMLRLRPDGTKRIVICYLSIGEAENYRGYWKRRWFQSPPAWLGPENPAWKGNFLVRYWDPEWQRLILDPGRAALTLWDRVLLALFPQAQRYLDHILESGFDGVYLDRVDAYEKPLEARPTAKADMIAFVEKISAYAKKRRPGFLVVPQNGEELLAEPRYRRAIDGVGKEDLMYGETGDGIANSPPDVRHTIAQLNRARTDGRPVFVIEYIAGDSLQRTVAAELRRLGFVPTFSERGLNLPPTLPPPP